MRADRADARPHRALWLLLRGADARRTRHDGPRARVVLLHGWLQAHDCWLPTATALRDGGHDVLLFDFYGHGQTDVPSADAMSLHRWTMLVAERIAAVGWDDGPKLSMAGCSMGAAVASRFAFTHPDRVARLTLITPPGLPEAWFMPCHPVREVAKVICRTFPRARWAHILRVIRTTPEYGMPLDALIQFAETGRLRLAVFVAEWDIVHTPHLEYWRAAAERVARGAHPDGMKVVCVRHTHWHVCTHLDELRLHEDESLWHVERDDGANEAVEPPDRPRARL